MVIGHPAGCASYRLPSLSGAEVAPFREAWRAYLEQGAPELDATGPAPPEGLLPASFTCTRADGSQWP